MKDVLWCGLLELDVPHEGDAVRLVRRVFVVVVGGNQQLGVLSRGEHEETAQGDSWEPPVCVAHLRGPVQAGDDAMLGPVLVVEESAQRQAGPRAQVSGKRDRADFEFGSGASGMVPVVKRLPVVTVVSLARCGRLEITDVSTLLTV